MKQAIFQNIVRPRLSFECSWNWKRFFDRSFTLIYPVYMWWLQKTQFGQNFFFTVKRTTELYHLPKAYLTLFPAKFLSLSWWSNCDQGFFLYGNVHMKKQFFLRPLFDQSWQPLYLSLMSMWPDFALICHIAALRLCHVAALMFFCLSSGLSNELFLVSTFKIKLDWTRQRGALSLK